MLISLKGTETEVKALKVIDRAELCVSTFHSKLSQDGYKGYLPGADGGETHLEGTRGRESLADLVLGAGVWTRCVTYVTFYKAAGVVPIP